MMLPSVGIVGGWAGLSRLGITGCVAMIESAEMNERRNILSTLRYPNINPRLNNGMSLIHSTCEGLQIRPQALGERPRERIPCVLSAFEHLGIVTALDLADESLRRVVVDSRYERQVPV